MSDGMSDGKNYGPSLSKHARPIISREGKPINWNGSPKGCWNQHPLSGEICQLPPDGHKIHKREMMDHASLECWE